VSGALAGDAFGSVVVAGHIDSRVHGLGFFARLLDVRPGDRMTLGDRTSSQSYSVASIRRIPKSGLATTSDSFSQRAPGRLVLITCTGRFDPATRHYEENLVVLAEPIGVATPAAR
jgi:sortase (surface protein transpeptidase)